MPEATVAAIITHKDTSGTKILLTRRGIEPFRGYWCLPGGHVDPNEPTKAAVIREVKEETGLDFYAHFFGYFDEIIAECEHHAVVMVFDGSASGILSRQQDEVTDIGWFPINEARSLPLAYSHNEIIDAYIRRNFSPEVRKEILAEYRALKDEIIQRTEVRHRLLFWTLLITGTLITASEKGFVTPPVLLIYPLLAVSLAAAWTQCDVRIGELGEYIRINIEHRLEGLGWEEYMRQEYPKAEKWLLRHLVALAGGGVFVVSSALVLLFVGYKSNWTFSIGEKIFLTVDGVVITLTWRLVTTRRRMYRDTPDFVQRLFRRLASWCSAPTRCRGKPEPK